ncbi:hypothetical protein BT96DRAFT_989512 [Gymnopus androsaceus JB14]|uniref:Uncharacterized protein n=1 Tax=Gymnopus androsaceus JB14 TaxID=1447944 RepID=A0A6A4I648_9AGAR|nr:hypothetical protein BT96DRAFT_989512 [Gymnopus androsaceus JB14]
MDVADALVYETLSYPSLQQEDTSETRFSTQILPDEHQEFCLRRTHPLCPLSVLKIKPKRRATAPLLKKESLEPHLAQERRIGRTTRKLKLQKLRLIITRHIVHPLHPRTMPPSRYRQSSLVLKPPLRSRTKSENQILAEFIGSYIFSLLDAPDFQLTDEVQTEIPSSDILPLSTGPLTPRKPIFPEGIPYSGPGGPNCIDMLFRLFLLALRLGAAWFEDGTIKMQFWALSMDIAPKDVRKMELEALDLLHFSLYISPEHWNAFIKIHILERSVLHQERPYRKLPCDGRTTL